MTTQVTAAQLAQLRRMVGEPLTTTYSDALLTTMIEAHALIDSQGEEPYELDESSPPVATVNTEWIATYDLNATAADIWDEKLSALTLPGSTTPVMDFGADGSYFRGSQTAQMYAERARYFRSRSSPKTMTLHKWPEETSLSDYPWIANLPEDV